MKKNGFVFLETIVVISVLSITLLLLFSSYSFMLRKSRERDTFDNYKASRAANDPRSSIKFYIDKNSLECKKMSSYNSYVCDLSSDSYSGSLLSAKAAFEADKIYLLNPNELLKSSNKNNWLALFDATTIDYINELFKNFIEFHGDRYYGDDGAYEVFHSSIEV